MFLLVSDLGTIVWGVSAANATGAAKALFFCVGLIYGSNTFYNAARVYIEAFHTVPKGICRNLVMALAWMFFVSWGMFPLGFVAGKILNSTRVPAKRVSYASPVKITGYKFCVLTASAASSGLLRLLKRVCFSVWFLYSR